MGAGETASFEYTVRARRGTHGFGDARVLVRNVSGTVERTRTVDLPTELSCRVGLDGLPLTSQTTPFAGRVDADAPGEGVAFHSTRQFRPSDPLHRIDWKRYARDRELTTVQFQETRAATVVLLVDARDHVRVTRTAGEHDAAEYAAFAAARIAGVQLDASNRVGAALYGYPSYLEPGLGDDQRLRIGLFLREGLATGGVDDADDTLFDTGGGVVEAMSRADPSAGAEEPPTPTPDGGERSSGLPRETETMSWHGPVRSAPGTAAWSLSWLNKRLPNDAQVVFCTPLLDDRAANTARQLEAHGHGVTVVSPDVTTDETPGGLVARIERRQRLQELRAELRVVEWAPEEALAAAVDRSSGGWT
jgi:hypothetical protein